MAQGSTIPNRVIFKHLAPDRLKVEIGGGWPISMFGLVFLLPGLAIILIGLGIIPILDGDAHGMRWYALFGLCFFLPGASVICYRRWLTFDVRRGVLVSESRLLIPMLRQERRLQEFSSVTILSQVTSVSSSNGGSRPVKYYPVILATGTPGNGFIVNGCATYQQAFALAATLAEFLGLPVRDLSTDHLLAIAPTDLAHPLQARLRADATLQQQAAPATLLSQVEESPAGALISIPDKTGKSCMNPFVLSLFIFAAFLFIATLVTCLEPSHPRAVIQNLMLGPAVLCTGVAVLVTLRNDWIARHSSTVVLIDQQGITIEERRGKRTRKRVVVPLADMIDIDYKLDVDFRRSKGSKWGTFSGSEGVCLKTKNGLFTFGAGLPDAEVEYLAMVVERALWAVVV